MGKSIKKAAGFLPVVAGAKFIGKKLGIGLEDEQGAYNDQAELQNFLRKTDDSVDPTKGMNMATDFVRNNALTKGVYGDGGLQSQLGAEGQELASRGFQLTQDDREAYGQASADVARMFGQQEQDAAKALARRGLGSASSGAAGAAFSGLAGNKNEMLAKAQMNIAQRRMDNTTQRLQQNRQLQASLAQDGNRMAQQQYGNQVGARQNRISELQGLEASKSGVMAAQQAAVKPGLFSTIGQGLQAGIGNLATQAPGMLVTGGLPFGGGGGGTGSALGGKGNTFAGPAKPSTSLFGSSSERFA
jgi:hypothetical protein